MLGNKTLEAISGLGNFRIDIQFKICEQMAEYAGELRRESTVKQVCIQMTATFYYISYTNTNRE